MRCDCFSQHPHGAKGHMLPMSLDRRWFRAALRRGRLAGRMDSCTVGNSISFFDWGFDP
jgi:hypothetical protein